MARPGGASMLICTCNVNAAYLDVLHLVVLGLGAFHRLALGVASFLPIARGLLWLLLSPWLPQCLFVPVGHL